MKTTLTSEALLISSLLLSEEERNKMICRSLASSGVKQSGSPLYAMLMISMGEVDTIFEDADYVELHLIQNWDIHCLFILQTMS